MDRLADEIADNVVLDETALQWEHIEGKALQFKRCLRPLLRTVPLDAIVSDHPLIEAVKFCREAFDQQKGLRLLAGELPARFIPDRLKCYLYTPDASGEKRLQADRGFVTWIRENQRGDA